MNPALVSRPCIAELPPPAHICQKMSYEWFFRAIGEDNWKAYSVLDFGPGGYPLAALLARFGARVSWLDRDPRCSGLMAGLAKSWAVALKPRPALKGEPVDVVIASNAIQHNETDAGNLYRAVADILTPSGCLLVSEKLAQGESRWAAERKDPCWARTLADHEALWRAAGLVPRFRAQFWYSWNADPAKESAYWTTPERAVQVVARLERKGAEP